MHTNLKLAWRNIWRNRRRTMITVASIFFGVLLSTFMSSMQEGTYSKMIDNLVGFYSGYLQIHHPEYWENKMIDNTFEPDSSLTSLISNSPLISNSAPRLESFALMSYQDNTKGGAVIGIDPEKENSITRLSHWVEKGEYLKNGDQGLLLAKNLAKNLGVEIGDTLVLISQGYHGVSAAGLFPVRGILKFPSPILNNLGAYMDIQAAQAFFSVPNKLTSTVLMVRDYSDVDHTKKVLQSSIGNTYSIMTWNEMDPLTDNMIKADRAQGVITKVILFGLIAFGVFGTIIMMMAERRKENGIMIAIGMQKKKLHRILLYETILLGMIGVFVGFLISYPLMLFFVYNPIPLTGEMGAAYEQFGLEPMMYFSVHWSIFVEQVLIVFGICMVVYIFPFVKVQRLKLSKALHS